MGIALVIFGPLVVAWGVLAAMPRGLPFLIAFGLVIALCAIGLLKPLPPPSGPDDWYRGIGRAGATLALAAALSVVPAQALRWWKGLSPLPYVGALLVCAVVGFFTTLSLGIF